MSIGNKTVQTMNHILFEPCLKLRFTTTGGDDRAETKQKNEQKKNLPTIFLRSFHLNGPMNLHQNVVDLLSP